MASAKVSIDLSSSVNFGGFDTPGTEQGSRYSSESPLLRQLRKGDPHAFEQISHQYRGRLLRLALKILKNLQDAEDAVQEALFMAFLKIDTFRARSSLYTWLTSILVNCCFMQLRKKRKVTVLSLDETRDRGNDTWSDTLASDVPAIDEVLVLDEWAAAVREVVGGLRPDLRLILTARYQENLSLPEVASQLNLSVPATKSRASRARKLCARNIRMRMGDGTAAISTRNGL
jgi:RNA polymerase sigma-70 factor, ECF subfamily